MHEPRPELVIFDCDGVLVDSEPLSLRVWVETLGRAGHAIDLATASEMFLGRSMATNRRAVADAYGWRMIDADVERLRRDADDLFRRELRAIAGMDAVLDALDLPVCVASSGEPARIRLSLETTGLARHFGPHVFSAVEVAHGKPAPDLFLHAAARMGAAPAACLVIEDSRAGIMAAKAALMRVFAFTGGGHARGGDHRAQLAALGPNWTFEAMPDLLPKLIPAPPVEEPG